MTVLRAMAKLAVDRFLDVPRFAKRVIALAVDASLCITSVALAFWLRLGWWVTPDDGREIAYVLAVAIAIPIFIRFGLYRAIFRYAGWVAMVSVAKACAVYGLVYATLFTTLGFFGVPRTIGILQPILLFLLIGASRAIIRYWLTEPYRDTLGSSNRSRVVVYGAGAAGRQLANAMAGSTELKIVAFVDDDKTLQGCVLNGLEIHAPDRLGEITSTLEIDQVLLALPGSSRKRRQEIVESIIDQTAARHISIRTLPTLHDLASGNVTVNDIREVAVDDLLGRDPVPPNHLLLARNIRGKTVLVTGAGGSIGQELCRQILAQQPRVLVLLDASEFNLYSIDRELNERLSKGETGTRIVPHLASVQDAKTISAIVETWKPDTIYHAAAYKHVPLVESNVAEGIRNNVFGTLNVALAAREQHVQDFVLISTDKAVRPTNIMGATKRLAEQTLQALAEDGRGRTRFSMVRFGNVLGSSGSVVPLFRQQIEAGGPVTLTHKDVTRYFMTIPEAAQLVIQAGAMASGGEVFVLDMGEPVRIADLARLMIELSGLTVADETNPHGDVAIRVVGMRPGEKLYEELLIGNDPKPTNHARIMKASEHYLLWPELKNALDQLLIASQTGDHTELIRLLNLVVPEYRPDNSSRDAKPREVASL